MRTWHELESFVGWTGAFWHGLGLPQVSKRDPAAGVAVRVTVELYGSDALHGVVPASQPAVHAEPDFVIRPSAPSPLKDCFVTESDWYGAKTALTVVRVALSGGVDQVDAVDTGVVLVFRSQCMNVDVAFGAAVRVTTASFGKENVQAPGQLIPAGLDVTVPPAPVGVRGSETKVIVSFRVALPAAWAAGATPASTPTIRPKVKKR